MDNVTVKKSPIQGYGVYANKNFRKGDTVLFIDDSYVVLDGTKLTKHQHEFECDYLANGKIILMQEPEKYINHSCNPNTFVKTINGVRRVLAMRDIKIGEEITYDYIMNSYNDGTFRCNCGSKNCRGIYQGNFFKLPKAVQLKYLPYLEEWFVQEHKQKIEKLRNIA